MDNPRVTDTSKNSTESESESAKISSEALLTTKDACKFLRISPRTLYRYIREYNLPAFKLGREWRFVKSELDRWLLKKLRKSKRDK